uniref:Uncharacterized protein n=1 Tax=Anguilla anguilla TaxID=7936 RepID=A0A0E9QK72_ANGAN
MLPVFYLSKPSCSLFSIQFPKVLGTCRVIQSLNHHSRIVEPVTTESTLFRRTVLVSVNIVCMASISVSVSVSKHLHRSIPK